MKRCLKHLRKHLKKHYKHMQHLDKTHLKTLKTYARNMHVYATSISTFATSQQNTCNIRLEQMKYLEHILETYVYNHYNMCSTLIYTYNIDIQHLQHTSETYETLVTYYCNMLFQRSICLLLGRIEARRRRARRWHRARSYEVTQRSPV
jgi:hypothetical protein